MSGPREVETVEKTVGATDVLVAANDINLGDSVRADDLKWQQWPVEGVTPGLITRSAEPDAPTQLSGAVARAPFIAGEPIKEQKLIKISRRRRDGRHPAVRHARHLHADPRRDLGRRLHPA